MIDQAQVVVIGGGVMGCSTLYHLAKLGITDAVLLERDKLTSGTTWHSAAQVRQLRSTRNMTQLIKYSTELYSSLEEETGQSTGWVRSGSLSIATNADRLIHIRRQAALAGLYGVEAHDVGPDDIKGHWPLVNADDIIGGVYSPNDGRVNPSDLCLALSKGAKARGGRILENTPVEDFVIEDGRVCGVVTPSGTIRCETIVLCGGLWSRDLAQKAGVCVPLMPCHHYYLLTKPIEGIESHLPTLSDHDSHLYIRDDVGGLLVGCFEPEGIAIEPGELGEDFAFSLLPEDWDHFEPMMVNALHRIPALETAEVRTLLNGPESFTPDSAFMLGEAPEVAGFYLCCGLNSVGLATGGGAGKAIAEWVVGGAAPMDLGEIDPRRYSPAENETGALKARVSEVLGKHYEITYPGREWTSSRNLKLMPLHQRFVEANARFGQRFAWERPLYFGGPAEPVLSWGRPAWFDQVGLEVKAAHETVALFDQSTYGKIDVHGPDAEAFLQRLCANDMSRAPGRAIYTAMLNERGGFESDLTALRMTDDRYRLQVGTSALRKDLSWLKRHLREGERVTIEDRTEEFAMLAVMGPRAPELMQGLVGDALDGLSYFSHREVELAGSTVQAARISYVGEAGWELTVPANRAVAVCDALFAHGAELGLVHAGAYAQTAMRVEKKYLSMGHDMGPDDTPFEAGVSFAVKFDKDIDFIGRDALLRRRDDGVSQNLVSITLEESDAQPLGHEPILCDGKVVGQVTSAAFGYRVGRPVVLGYVPVSSDGYFDIDIAGDRYTGLASLGCAFDPDGSRMKAGG